MPFETFAAQVDRIAPAAEPGDARSTVTVCCRLHNSPESLHPGLTGHARIQTGRRRIAKIALDRVLRYIRTEFWW